MYMGQVYKFCGQQFHGVSLYDHILGGHGGVGVNFLQPVAGRGGVVLGLLEEVLVPAVPRLITEHVQQMDEVIDALKLQSDFIDGK